MNKIKRLLSVAIVTIMLISLFPTSNVLAAPSATMSITGNTEVGSVITVSVKLNSDGLIGGYNGSFSYDNVYFELQSISIGDYTSANFSADGANFADFGFSISSGTVMRAKFKCLAAGTGSISCYFEDVGDEFGTSIGSPSCGASVTVITPVPKSSNSNLSALTVSPGTLSPAFSKTTRSYSMTVGEDQSKITVSATPEDSKAKVSLNGVQNNIKPGANTVKITVTAEDGTTKVYSIVVTRASGPTGTPTPTPQPLPLITYLGDDLMIIPFDENTTIPEGFTATTSTYKGIEIPVFKGPASEGSTDEILLVQLLTEQKVKYFVYEPTEQIVYPLLFIAQEETSLRLLDAGDSIQAPTGYEKFEFEYDGEPVNAYRLISDPNHPQILLYMMDALGKEVFYYYDTEQKMLMPYRGEMVLVDPTVTPTPSPDPSASTTEALVTDDTVPSDSQPTATERKTLLENLSDFKSPFTIMFYLVALIALVLSAAVISLMIGRKSDYEEDYDEDYLPDDEPVPPLAVYPAGGRNRIHDPDDVFEENYSSRGKISDEDYIPSIVRTTTVEKPISQPTQPLNSVKSPDRPVADSVPVMGVRRVQLDSIPELAEPAKAIAPLGTLPGTTVPGNPSAQLTPPVRPVTQASPAVIPGSQSAPTVKPASQPSVEPNNNPKVQNPIPEHIPVRLKLELDEAINKASTAEQVKVPSDSPTKTTSNTVHQAPVPIPEKAPSVSNAPPVQKAPSTPSEKSSDADFGLRYVPGNVRKEPVAPAKEGPSLDFPDISRKSETPIDPDLD